MSDECSNATTNPKCPYLEIIRGNRDLISAASSDIHDVKVLLIGDMKDPEKPGVVERLREIDKKISRRWSLKDVGQLLLGVSALIVALSALIGV